MSRRLILPRRDLLRGLGAGLICAPAIIRRASASRTGFSVSNSLTVNSAVVSALPITLVGWGYATDFSGSPYIATISKAAELSAKNVIRIGFNPPPTIFANEKDDGATNGTATSSLTPTTSTWYGVAGVFASTTSRTVYANGGNSATNSTTLSTLLLDTTAIGSWITNSAPANSMAGRVGEVSVYNVALTALECGNLTNPGGATPAWKVRPASLFWYVPCWGIASPEPDYSGKHLNATITGSLSKADNPPMAFYSAHADDLDDFVRGRPLGGTELAEFLLRMKAVDPEQPLACLGGSTIDRCLWENG